MTPEKLEKALNQIINKVESEVTQWLTTLKTEGKSFVFNRTNLLIANGFNVAFQEILRTSGYLELASIFNKNVAAMLKKHKLARPFLKLRKKDLDLFKAFQQVNFNELMTIGRRAGDILQTNIISTIVSGDQISNLRPKLISVLDNRLKRYTETYITTAERVMIQKTEELGSKYLKNRKWEYVGPRDNKNRAECIEGLQRKYFTDSEKKEFQAKYGIRWNCRHVFQVVESE